MPGCHLFPADFFTLAKLCPRTIWVQPALSVRAVRGSLQVLYFSLQALALQLCFLDPLLCLLPPSRVCALPSP